MLLSSTRFLVLANEEDIENLKGILDSHIVLPTNSLDEAVQLLEKHNRSERSDEVIGYIIVDPILADSADFYALFKKIDPLVSVLAISDEALIDSAVDNLKKGAYSYLVKPFDRTSVLSMFSKIEDSEFCSKAAIKTSLNRFVSQFNMRLTINTILEIAMKNHLAGEKVDISDIVDSTAGLEPNIKTVMTEVLSQGTPKILVVEDEKMWLSNYKMFLRKAGLICFTADCGEAALEIAKTEPGLDVATLDIYLPDIKGDMLLPAIKELQPQIEVIVATGYEEIDVANKTFQDGACDYINKPFYEEDLIQKIHKALVVKYIKDIFIKYKTIETGGVLSREFLI